MPRHFSENSLKWWGNGVSWQGRLLNKDGWEMGIIFKNGSLWFPVCPGKKPGKMNGLSETIKPGRLVVFYFWTANNSPIWFWVLGDAGGRLLLEVIVHAVMQSGQGRNWGTHGPKWQGGRLLAVPLVYRAPCRLPTLGNGRSWQLNKSYSCVDGIAEWTREKNAMTQDLFFAFDSVARKPREML